MPSSRDVTSSLLAMVATCALGAGAALIDPGSAAATTAHVWYAGPHGSGSTCSKSAPCELFHAVNGSVFGDTVILEPGTYNNAGTPYSAELDVRASIFEGEPGKPMPVIQSAPTGPVDGVEIFGGVTAHSFKVEFAGEGNGISVNNGTISHVFVSADTTGGPFFAAACQIDGGDSGGFTATLTDSVCLQAGAGSAAVGAEANGANAGALLRNVTAISSGTNGVAIEVRQDGDATTTYDVINSIVEGTSDDLEAEWLGSGSPGKAIIDVSHSAYVTTSTTATNASILPGAGNIKKRAAFVDLTHGKLQEKSTSPTVDKGTAAGIGAHELDLAGSPRDLGKTPDMGAYELAEKPTATTPKLSRKGKRSLTFTTMVDPEGLATTLVLKVAHHPHLGARSVSAGSGHSAHSVTLHLTGLARNSKYKVYVVATNRTGRFTTGKRTARTSKY